MREDIKKFADIIDKSNNIVFFGGAGVSTESNIPDFRSDKGLYNAQHKYSMSPEAIISHDYFLSNTDTFFEYYKENLIYEEAEPNKAHLALAKLEREGKLKAVITQNIDGLHQLAGSKNVFELHGSVLKNTCMKCGKHFTLEYILDDVHCKGHIPLCDKCGDIVKPDVVLYQEPLDDMIISGAVNAIKEADTLIVGGTSLVIYPAAGLINYFRGKNLILINKQATSYDNKADLVFRDAIGEIMGYLL